MHAIESEQLLRLVDLHTVVPFPSVLLKSEVS